MNITNFEMYPTVPKLHVVLDPCNDNRGRCSQAEHQLRDCLISLGYEMEDERSQRIRNFVSGNVLPDRQAAALSGSAVAMMKFVVDAPGADAETSRGFRLITVGFLERDLQQVLFKLFDGLR